MILATVKVKRDGPKGYRLINKSEFNSEVHELFDAAPKEPSGPTAKQLKALLDEKKVAYPANASKAELQALLDAPPKTDGSAQQ